MIKGLSRNDPRWKRLIGSLSKLNKPIKPPSEEEIKRLRKTTKKIIKKSKKITEAQRGLFRKLNPL
jgi:uncharacterized protein YdcH (DUF465 family)